MGVAVASPRDRRSHATARPTRSPRAGAIAGAAWPRSRSQNRRAEWCTASSPWWGAREGEGEGEARSGGAEVLAELRAQHAAEGGGQQIGGGAAAPIAEGASLCEAAKASAAHSQDLRVA